MESQRSMERVEEFVIYPSTEMVLDDVRISKGIAKLEKEHKAQAKLLKEQFHTEQYARLNKMVESVLEELKEFNSTMGLDSMVEYFYDDTVSFLDYFPTDTDIFIDDPERVNQRAGAYAMQFGMSMEGRLEGGYVLPTQANVLYDAKTVVARLVNRTPVLLSELYKKQPAWKEQYAFQIDAKGLVSYNNSFEDLMKDIEKYKKKDYRILILSPSATRGKRIAKNLQDNDVMAYFTENREQPLKPGEVRIRGRYIYFEGTEKTEEAAEICWREDCRIFGYFRWRLCRTSKSWCRNLPWYRQGGNRWTHEGLYQYRVCEGQ